MKKLLSRFSRKRNSGGGQASGQCPGQGQASGQGQQDEQDEGEHIVPIAGEIVVQVHFPPTNDCLDVCVAEEGSTIGDIRVLVENLYGISLKGDLTLSEKPLGSALSPVGAPNSFSPSNPGGRLEDHMSLREAGLKNESALYHWDNSKQFFGAGGNPGTIYHGMDGFGAEAAFGAEALGAEAAYMNPQLMNAQLNSNGGELEDTTGEFETQYNYDLNEPFGPGGGPPPPIVNPRSPGNNEEMTEGDESHGHESHGHNYEGEEDLDDEEAILAQVLEQSRREAEEEEAKRQLEEASDPPNSPESPTRKTVKLRFAYDDQEAQYLTFPLESSFESMTILLRGIFLGLPPHFSLSYCGNKLDGQQTPKNWQIQDNETLLIEAATPDVMADEVYLPSDGGYLPPDNREEPGGGLPGATAGRNGSKGSRRAGQSIGDTDDGPFDELEEID